MKSVSQRVVLGSIIIGVGVLALFDKLNLLQIGHFFQFWPTIFLVAGLIKIAKAKTISRAVSGLGFIAIAVILTLNNLGIIHVGWHEVWPMILIFVGLSIVFKDHSKKCSHDHWGQEVTTGDDTKINISAILGGNKTTNNSQDFKGGEITAMMGGVELDLRSATIQSEAVLNLSATWGGILLRVPNDWNVINQGTAILGAIENKTIPATHSNKRLIITGMAIMGGVEIKN